MNHTRSSGERTGCSLNRGRGTGSSRCARGVGGRPLTDLLVGHPGDRAAPKQCGTLHRRA